MCRDFFLLMINQFDKENTSGKIITLYYRINRGIHLWRIDI